MGHIVIGSGGYVIRRKSADVFSLHCLNQLAVKQLFVFAHLILLWKQGMLQFTNTAS